MGEVPPLTDNIGRLKELLFDSEAQSIADLGRRIEALGESEGRGRAELAARLEELAQRVGGDIELEASVAAVLDGALRRAESAHHHAVSDAVAPFVVNTVRTEIRNSRDELVEALYPVTGRIVKAYVASAMKDLVAQINRRLEANPIMLRIRSITTGRPVAELAIADSQRLALDELYLIRRGTGELVEHWPDEALGSNRDQVMSGVLAAINEFATEAFEARGDMLRQIDLGEGRVYLRASPAFLLAAKCSGTAPRVVEQVLDEGFLNAIAHLGPAASDGTRSRVLPGLAETMGPAIAARQDELSADTAGVSPVKLLAWGVGVPLVAWLAWSFYADWRVSRTTRIAQDVLSQSAEIKGYPTRVATGRLGQSVEVSGLAPTVAAKERVLQRLSLALPGVALSDAFAVVPNALADVEPELTRLRDETAGIEPRIGAVRDEVDALARKFKAEADRREVERAVRRLARAKATIAPLAADLAPDETRLVTDVLAVLDGSLAELAAMHAGTDEAALRAVAARTSEASRDLSSLLVARPSPDTGAGEPAATAAGAVVAAAEEIDLMSVAFAQTVALKRALPRSTPRERLEAWTRANAIFFSAEADYREPEAAQRKIAELAALMQGNDSVLRIIGYTDGIGTSDRNAPLSQARAERVAADLAAAGIAASRLRVLGRAYALDISPDTGSGSPNRRVEFELGFEDEAPR